MSAQPAAAPIRIDPVAVAPPATPDPMPVRIVIPSIGLKADLEALHRGADGTLNPPRAWEHAGWYADGVVPGERGPGVILGHAGSARHGPAVFDQLPRLRSGDIVMIDSSNGHTEYFFVDAVRQFAETSFPTKLVYGPTPLPELRLITCADSFDHAKRGYRDNLIVTAYSAWTPQL